MEEVQERKYRNSLVKLEKELNDNKKLLQENTNLLLSLVARNPYENNESHGRSYAIFIELVRKLANADLEQEKGEELSSYAEVPGIEQALKNVIEVLMARDFSLFHLLKVTKELAQKVPRSIEFRELSGQQMIAAAKEFYLNEFRDFTLPAQGEPFEKESSSLCLRCSHPFSPR